MGFRYVGTLCGPLNESVKLNQSNSWALCRISVRNRDPVGARLILFFILFEVCSGLLFRHVSDAFAVSFGGGVEVMMPVPAVLICG